MSFVWLFVTLLDDVLLNDIFFESLTFYPLERDDFVLTCHFSACKALCYHSSVAPEGRRWVYPSCLLCKYLYRGEKRSPTMAATTTPPSANFSFNALALTGQLFHHHSSNWGEWRQKPWNSWGWGKFGTLELTGYDASTWCGRIRRERQPTLTTMLPTPHALFFYLCVVLSLWGLDLRAYLHWHVRQWAYRSSRCGSVDMSRFISRIGFFMGRRVYMINV